MRRISVPNFQVAFPTASPDSTARRLSNENPPSEKLPEPQPISPVSPISPIFSGKAGPLSRRESAPSIDPSFMGTISAILDPSQVPTHSRTVSHTGSLSSSRYSDIRAGSIKSDSTIILPQVFGHSSRQSSNQNSMFAPTRFNSAIGPWRDSVWSAGAAATPTSVMPPSSASSSYFPNHRQSRSLSYANSASMRNTGVWSQNFALQGDPNRKSPLPPNLPNQK
jgi:hypothetical protein